jgi:hypothetical protein
MEDKTWKAATSKGDLVHQSPTELEGDPKIHNPMKYSGAMETVARFCEVSQSETYRTPDIDIIILPYEPSPTISAWQQFWRACIHFISCDK